MQINPQLRHRSRKLFMVGTVTMLVLGLVLSGLWEPQTRLGIFLFRCAYASPLNKRDVLTTYGRLLRQTNGSYLPADADKFLCARLEAGRSEAEATAIVDFYVNQAGGREGDGIAGVSEATKQRTIAMILQQIEGYDTLTSQRALILVEELRQGRVMFKPAFGPEQPDNPEGTGSAYRLWWKDRGRAIVTARYRRWFGQDTSWQVKRLQNPLEGSGIAVYEP